LAELGGARSVSTRDVSSPDQARIARKLDFFISTFNRQNYLHHILKTGLALSIPGAYFVVFDDASNDSEHVPDLGTATTEMVCRSFGDERVIYIRNETNLGFAKSLERYYRDICNSDYVGLLNPKDEFISGAAIHGAIRKLDADPAVSMVVYPLREVNRQESDKPLLFKYQRMSGAEYVARYVRDAMLQHCSSYAIIRVAAARKVGIPRNLDLRKYGIEDGSGIDHDIIFNVATTGDVEFETEPPLRRRIVGGYTELYPLSFAYSQYQYARRLMIELKPRGFVSFETRRHYLSLWHLIMTRGLVIAYRPRHGTELERGVKRIRAHLPLPIWLYLPMECLRFGLMPEQETVRNYRLGVRYMFQHWLKQTYREVAPAPLQDAIESLIVAMRGIIRMLLHPALLYGVVARLYGAVACRVQDVVESLVVAMRPRINRLKRIIRVLFHPALLYGAIARRLRKVSQRSMRWLHRIAN
jgi:hypothetical protein